MKDDHYWMKQAIELAKQAELKGEVPVGAILVKDNQLIAKAHNQPISLNDPTAHAEILAIRQAAQQLQNYRLNDTTLYVTLEPCPMCAAALVHARIKRLVYGARDPRIGAAGSVFNLVHLKELNHRIEWNDGILEQECEGLLQSFFREKRKL